MSGRERTREDGYPKNPDCFCSGGYLSDPERQYKRVHVPERVIWGFELDHLIRREDILAGEGESDQDVQVIQDTPSVAGTESIRDRWFDKQECYKKKLWIVMIDRIFKRSSVIGESINRYGTHGRWMLTSPVIIQEAMSISADAEAGRERERVVQQRIKDAAEFHMGRPGAPDDAGEPSDLGPFNTSFVAQRL